MVADAMGTSNARYDVNGDGTVNFLDLLLVFDNRDAGAAGAPTVVGMKMSAAQIDIIEEQIDLLIATNDRSPAAMRTLVYLQQLLVTARPEKTQLLANYPNPFNPETWIPYELATDTNVRHHDIQHAGCCDPVVAVWTSVGWLLRGSGSCGVLGWSECAWRTGCEWFVFLSARNRRDVVDAEDGYFEVVFSFQWGIGLTKPSHKFSLKQAKARCESRAFFGVKAAPFPVT